MWAVLVVVVGGAAARCRIPHLGPRTLARSDTVLSAAVKSFYMKEAGGPFAGRATVRRVFRGDPGLEGRSVVVQGLGEPSICLSNPRLGDTKLFFLKTVPARGRRSGKVFRLNDNIRKLNLMNLKTLGKLRRGVGGRTGPRGCPGLTTNLTTDCLREPRAALLSGSRPGPLLVVTPPPSLCSFQPCDAGGTCEEHDGTFSCHCSPHRTGRYCELQQQDTAAGFTGNSFLSLPPPTSWVTRTSVQFSFRSYSGWGLLLYSPGRPGGDWLLVRLAAGRVEVHYELGSGETVLSSQLLPPGPAWHSVSFRRYHRDALLQVDAAEPVRARARGRSKSLNIRSNTFLGGWQSSNSSKGFGFKVFSQKRSN